jgi:hypothetical protein
MDGDQPYITVAKEAGGLRLTVMGGSTPPAVL